MKALLVRIPDEQYEAIRRVAFERHVPMAQVVRERLTWQEEPWEPAPITSLAAQLQMADKIPRVGHGSPKTMRDVIKERLGQ